MLVVLGLNHNSAPVTVRERMAIKKEEMEDLYKKFLTENSVQELFILILKKDLFEQKSPPTKI